MRIGYETYARRRREPKRHRGRRYAALAAALLLAAPATAVAGPRAQLQVSFAQTGPGVGTRLSLHILYRDPAGPNVKPPAIRGASIALPPGTRVDGAAVARCTATDAELMSLGRSACPAGSRVGGGSLVAITGFGPPFDPFPTDVTLFNSGDGVIELVQQAGTNQTLAIDRATVSGNVYASHPPRTPGGPPDGETVVRTIDFTLDGPAAGGRAFVTTPPSCPSGGAWISVGRFSFDGAVDEATSPTPCSGSTDSRPGAPSPSPRLWVAPDRVRHGHSRRFRLRVLAAAGSCRAGVLIRFAGRHRRTSATGRAAIRTSLSRPGRYRVRATKRGCPALVAMVVAR
jgi:hypothetical protein